MDNIHNCFPIVIGVVFLIIFLWLISNHSPNGMVTFSNQLDIVARGPNSHDLFDTLVARRYFSDSGNWKCLEEQLQIPGFHDIRRAVEHKTCDTIWAKYNAYPQLIELCNQKIKHSKNSRDKNLKNLKNYRDIIAREIDWEVDNLVPISYNLNRIRDGDWIITDTIYDEHIVRRILDKIGLDKKVTIIATPYGKGQNTVFRRVRGKVKHHFGDNEHSDGNARHHGIKPIINKLAVVTELEKYLLTVSPRLARLVREARLRNPYGERQCNHWVFRSQCEYNFPILLLFSKFLNNFCQKKGIKYVKCMLRDCCLFYHLFKRLYSDKYQIDKIYCSRAAMQHGNRYTREYLMNHFGNSAAGKKSRKYRETVAIDGLGLGTSFIKFHHKNNLEMPYCVNIFRYWSAQKLPVNVRKYTGHSFYNWLTSFDSKFNIKNYPNFDQMMYNRWDDFIEFFNLDTNGSFYQMDKNNTPHFKALEYPVEIAELEHSSFFQIMDIYFNQYANNNDGNNNNTNKNNKNNNNNKTFFSGDILPEISVEQIPHIVGKISDYAHSKEEYWLVRRKFHVP